MLRRRITHWNSKPDEDQYCVFSDSFWSYYVETLRSETSHDYTSNTPSNSTKYISSSPIVGQVRAFFTERDLPQPSINQIIASLKSPFTQGDYVKTLYFIRFFQLSNVGYFITNDGFDRSGCPIRFMGAENWENVMCYLDALLFSMFVNLESFEPILFLSNQHQNPLVSQLSGLLRVYVSLLRSGNLITTDVTRKICECLSKLGFTEAMSHRQQDCAPLFEFLTETLSMPLLTFRVEIQHSGKHDDDDTKFSKERILFVSIPEDEESSVDEPILLEECLEHYFNNSISVKRELERRASIAESRLNSQSSESVVASLPQRESNTSLSYSLAGYNSSLQRSSQVRTRSSTFSIWSVSSADSKPKEVMLPAWMLLRLVPFYTDDNDITKANESVATNSREFANRRPILPICLKRYSFSNHSTRSIRKIVIPPVIELPSFVADDETDEEDHFTNFTLILESAICHRGTTIDSGHFVSAVRKNTSAEQSTLDDLLDAEWYLYDDLKSTRVVVKSFKDIFESEWPYMLFYRLISNEKTPVDDLKSRVSEDFNVSPVVVPTGYKAKYWADEMTPILSAAEETYEAPMTTSETPTLNGFSQSESSDSTHKSIFTRSDLSIPIPKTSPSDPNFVDIRKRYLWYVTDKDKNYYRESASISKSGSRNMSISFTPQYRRNSQWSNFSNISGLSLDDSVSGTIATSKIQFDPDQVKQRLEDHEKSESQVTASKNEENHDTNLGAEKLEQYSPRRSHEHKHHLHRIFSHKESKDNAVSLAKKQVRKKHAEYKKEKCTIV